MVILGDLRYNFFFFFFCCYLAISPPSPLPFSFPSFLCLVWLWWGEHLFLVAHV